MKVLETIEMLRCAEINCDTAKRIPALLDMVKAQIQEALKLLDADEDEKESYRRFAECARRLPVSDALREAAIKARDAIRRLNNTRQDVDFHAYLKALHDALSAADAIDAALRSGDGCKPPEVRRNEDGTPDEVVADHAQVHLEQMSDTHWRLSIAQGGSTVLVNLMSRGKIGGTLEVEAGPDVDEAMAKPAGDGWTRVEDGLPQENGKYLLYIDGDISVYYLIGGKTLPHDVTHWRPMPPAPEDR